jgi:hypothetical protein
MWDLHDWNSWRSAANRSGESATSRVSSWCLLRQSGVSESDIGQRAGAREECQCPLRRVESEWGKRDSDPGWDSDESSRCR